MGLTKNQLEIIEGHYTEIKELGIILGNKINAANNYYSNVLHKHYEEQKEIKKTLEKSIQEAETSSKKETIVPKSKFNQGSIKKINGSNSVSKRSKRKSSTSK